MLLYSTTFIAKLFYHIADGVNRNGAVNRWLPTPAENIGNPTISLWWVWSEMNAIRLWCTNISVAHQHFQIRLITVLCSCAVNNQNFKMKKQLGNDLYIKFVSDCIYHCWVLPEFHEKIMQLLSKMWCSLCFHADLLLFWHLDYGLLVYNMRYCVILKCLDKYKSKCKHSLTEQFYRQKWCNFHSTACSYIEVLLK